MADGSRIPQVIVELGAYLSGTSTYLAAGTPTTNGVRLGILPAEQTQWIAINTSYAALLIKYLDKKNSRTTGVTSQLHLLRRKIVDLDRTVRFLDRIAASPLVTQADLDVFNIKNKTMKAKSRMNVSTAILENVSPLISAVGGGMFQVKCLTPDSKRAAIISGADCVQYCYTVGNTPPESPVAEGLKQGVSSRATFSIAVGAEYSAQNMYVFFRWYNIKRPEMAGPWCAMKTLLVV